MNNPLTASNGEGADKSLAATPIVTPDGGLPHARVLIVRELKSGRVVIVDCPFCGRQHMHGWPEEHEAVGVRVSHCYGRVNRRVNAPWRKPQPYEVVL